jgi:hypothetical protein
MLRTTIALIIVIIMIILIPSLKLVSNIYYLSASFFVIIFLIIGIYILPIIPIVKYSIIISILIYYKKNLYLVSNTFYIIFLASYINTSNFRKNNDIISKMSHKLLKSNFKLITNFENLPVKPTIFVCNYSQDRIEHLAFITLPRDIVFMMRDSNVYNNLRFTKMLKWYIFTKLKGGYNDNKIQVLKHLTQGRDIFVFITKYPKMKPNYIPIVRSGMFSIAKEINSTITLVAIDYIDIKYGIIPYQNFRIQIGDTFNVDDVKACVYKAKKFFKNTLSEFINTKYINLE